MITLDESSLSIVEVGFRSCLKLQTKKTLLYEWSEIVAKSRDEAGHTWEKRELRAKL